VCTRSRPEEISIIIHGLTPRENSCEASWAPSGAPAVRADRNDGKEPVAF
jgi:hypothetical protein